MLFHKTTLQLALCLTVGLSAAACSDDDGEGGGTTSTTSSSASTGEGGGATSSSSSASTGEGGSNEGGSNEGGSNEGGSNEGGSNEGGSNEGGSTGEGGSPPGDPACGADTAAFADVQAILTASCAGCHGNAGPPAGGLDLRGNAAHGGLVDGDSSTCADRVLVVPGKPSESYIINKLRNVDLCTDGKRMPPPPDPSLPEASIKKINDWICAGAPGS